MEFDLENPFTAADDDKERSDSFAALFAAESDHSLAGAAASVDLSARRDAASLILEAQFRSNLDPFVAYLAANYVDRFLFKRQIPRDKPWVARLLAISCLSLASKMKRGADYSIADFQGEEGFIFDAHTIHRMELLVLGALDWRMRSITPFSFLRFFVGLISPPLHPPLLHALKERTTQTLFKLQDEIKMLEFKPSLIAASALLAAARELVPIQYAAFRSAVSSCGFVNKERLWECYNAVAACGCDSALELEMASSADTPVTVLGRYCASSESERTVGSAAAPADRDLKKRRVSSAAPLRLRRFRD
ncbi:Cyclin-D6-1 [Ananas comosus]|uniref:Cyclin-D6-1 n=1 Tax=Ananas comosus TaxID=4615 RepID=A0A199VYL3_ANACO|nr:Cyclin-D6-1 [Ananas comosus]